MASGLPAFSGLARAFSFAGAKNLLVTHWQVRDDVAAFVSMETLKHYRRNGSKAEALRHAIHKLRFESTLPGREDPSVWAPFVLIKG
jgi:CHAT domain-containing protein